MICGGIRVSTGKLLDISKYVNKYLCKVQEYQCVDCGQKSILEETDSSHFKEKDENGNG